MLIPFYTIVKRIQISSKYNFPRFLTQSCTEFNVKEPTNTIKKDIESYWKEKIQDGTFDSKTGSNKFYVLSMFPYPSGSLHMGHVRVYSISDSMARFYRMNGKNVFHPMGWDAFGLPAENAAIERKIEPSKWTEENIKQMKEQLISLGCSFDWNHEIATCDKSYYKWTQKLFLMLYREGLAYQKEALVNWDPIDKTVLADEQVDSNGCSWRSGAKVEKKLLKQWFIRTTKFAKSLLDGLNDSFLEDWRDIINLQQHWIGDCNGYAFHLKLLENGKVKDFNFIRIWTQYPEHLLDSDAFVVLKTTHYLNKLKESSSLKIFNPFTSQTMPVIFNDNVEFPEHNESYLAVPSFIEDDKELAKRLNLPCNSSKLDVKDGKNFVLNLAQKEKYGGYQVSSKLEDWLVSRQRYWGTPIPVVHCDNCGVVPVNDDQLPIILPENHLRTENDVRTKCPKCGDTNAKKETDTLDTFVDSSWYYVRYLDSKNTEDIFDKDLVKKFMPVDLYIGGKEHAVLHLYYARFMNYFLHSLGLVPYPEPFKRLLVQGMVMGRSYRLKGTGKYLRENEVKIIDAKKNKAEEKSSGQPVVMSWEKMSKSKLNGVDPSDMISEYGCDTTRLITLADVAPTSHRNWSNATFPGILNWQKRLWLTINDFYNLRSNEYEKNFNLTDKKFIDEEEKMFDARNYYAKGVTFNFKYTHQLSVAISKMQGLTNSIRRATKDAIKYGKQYERALAVQIIMLAPMAPHFASELWSKFVSTPNRINTVSKEINWDDDVLQQKWPEIDMEYKLDLTIKINGFENCVIKLPKQQMDKITYNEAMDIAFNTESVTSYLTDKKIRTTNFVNYPGCETILNIYVDKIEKKRKDNGQKEELVNK